MEGSEGDQIAKNGIFRQQGKCDVKFLESYNDGCGYVQGLPIFKVKSTPAT